MIYEFLNGTQQQQDLWQEAITHLLHLPADQVPLTNVVSFVDPSEVAGGHTDLAATTFSYDSAESSTVVRDDAPGFGSQQAVMEAYAASLGLPFSVEKFYMESAAHELGHALYAALPQEQRVAIAQMFGAESDDLAEIDPEDQPWQDRIAEGIAETFKDAFLPRRYRSFSNRSNRKIAYHQYPAFRALWRIGVPEIEEELSKPLNELVEEMPSPDEFERIESPLSDGGNWEKWAPANNAGRVAGGGYEPINTLESAAIRVGERLSGGRFGVSVHPQSLLTGKTTKPGAILMFLAADNAGGGSGYRFAMELAKPETSTNLWNITVGYWKEGKLQEMLIELEEQFLEFTTSLEVALVLFNGVVSIWFTEGGGSFGELTSEVHSGGPREGFAGCGIDSSEVLPAHAPRLARFRCGEFVSGESQPPIIVPPSSVQPEGYLRGSRAKRRRIMGSVK